MKLFIKRRIPYQDHSTKMTSKWRFRALMVWWPLVFRTRQRSCLWALSARARQDKCLYCSRNSWNGSWEPTGFELSLLAESVRFFSSGFSIANPGGMGAGCIEYQMPDSPSRVLTPSPVWDITTRIQQMDGLSGRIGIRTPPSVASWNSLRAIASPQMFALGELEFDRFFLIRVYLAE